MSVGAAKPAGFVTRTQVQSIPRDVGRQASLTPGLLMVDTAVPVGWVLAEPQTAPGVLMVLAVAMMCWVAFGQYRNRFALSVLDDLPVLLLGIAAGTGAAAVLGLVLSAAVLPDLSGFLPAIAMVVVIGRAVLYRWMLRRRRIGAVCVGRAVVVGQGPTAGRLAENMVQHPDLGLVPVGVVGGDDPRLPRLGDVSELARIIPLYGTTHVLLALGASGEEQLTEVLRECRFRSVQVYEVSRFSSLRWAGGARSDSIWGIPVTDISSSPLTGMGFKTKRMADVTISVVLLVLLAPLMALVVLAVRVRITPRVIFRQERVGQNGKTFTLLKFTSMVPDRHCDPDSTWSIHDDPRLCAIGRFIRATSLDELPQLVNILRGDMSLVGPRPERPYFVNQYNGSVPDYQHRHRVPVGLTGFAQVHGLRGDTSIENRAVFDNVYIENWSLWLDVKIMLRTVIGVVGRHGG